MKKESSKNTKILGKGRTATGLSIGELALRLKKKNPDLSFEDAKEEAKKQLKDGNTSISKQRKLRESLEYGIGGKTKHAVMQRLFGRTAGSFLANKIRSKAHEESVANKIIKNDSDFNQPHIEEAPVTAKRITAPQGKEYGDVLKKLSTIETDVKDIKATKVEKPVEVPVPAKAEKSPHHATGMSYLKKAYKGRMTKAEMEAAVESTGGDTEQEFMTNLVKSGGKGGIGKKSEKIPTADVPKAVDDVKSAMLTPAANEDKHENAQKEALSGKEEQLKKDRDEKDEKEKKKIEKELDDIKKHLSGGGLLSLIGKFFGPLLAILPMIGTALAAIAPVLGGLVAIAGAAYAGYKIGQWLDKKFHLGEKASHAVSWAQNKLGLGGPDSIKAWHDNSISKLNKKLSGTGYTAMGAGQYKDSKGNVVKKINLPPSIKAKLDGVPKTPKISTTVPPAVKAKISAPATQAMAAAKIDSASTENAGMKSTPVSAPTVINKIDNRRMAPTPSNGNNTSDITIKTRNMEPSVGNYIGSIFNHPVVRLPV